MKTLKIGDVKLKNRLFLAPMVEVTDLPYRLICRKAGAGMAYIEMLNTGAILHTNPKTERLMKICKEDKPRGIQITGPRASDFEKVIPYLKDFDIVDINCGCPSVRTIDNQSGSYLLKTPEKIADYIRILKKTGLTVTAKIRLGFDNNKVIEVAKEVEKAGADALTVHARLAHHSYKIPADWTWIAKVKKEVGIPVIGNGDIFTGKHVSEMLDICDGAMIARAAIGDPLIFSRILYYLKTGKEKEFDFKDNIKLFNEYLKLAKKYQCIDVPRIKYVGSNFIRNVSGAGKIRNELMGCKDFNSIREFAKKI